jgi:hypothetical protein
MNRLAQILTALLLPLSGCDREAQVLHLDHGWAPPGACQFVGNYPNRHYCATTGAQILANPHVYDGQLVQLSGWVVASPDIEGAGLFLTRDALDASASHGSVSLEGPALGAIVDRANQDPPYTPMLATIVGRFYLNRREKDDQKVRAGPHFGVVKEVREDW